MGYALESLLYLYQICLFLTISLTTLCTHRASGEEKTLFLINAKLLQLQSQMSMEVNSGFENLLQVHLYT